MKKLTVFLLALALVLGANLSACADVAALSKTELDSYTENMLKIALTDGKYQAEPADGGYLLRFSGYALLTDSDHLTANSSLLGVTYDGLSDADDSMGDLRGIKLNDSLKVLLAAYPIENGSMAGTREEAVLYVEGELPGQASVGYVKRDGQRVLEIVHSLYYMADNGVALRKVSYTLKDGAVIGISVTLSGDKLTLKDAEDELDSYRDIRNANEYSAYLSGETGADAGAFDRDDLLFSGMDFLDLTPENARQVLGDDFAEDWLEDGDTYIHVMEWNAATITFVHDKQKNLLRVDSLYMDEDTLEGPRGIRVGDQQQNVIERFKSGAGEASGDLTYLYGAAGDESYATAEYVTNGQVSLRYHCVAGDKGIMMLLNMNEARLSSILLQME